MLWKPASRSRATLGTAVLTTAMSSMSIAVAAQTTVRVSRERFMSALLTSPQHVAVPEDAVRVEAVLELLQPGGVLGLVRRRNRSRALVRRAEEVQEPAGGVPRSERGDHPGPGGLDRRG